MSSKRRPGSNNNTCDKLQGRRSSQEDYAATRLLLRLEKGLKKSQAKMRPRQRKEYIP